ncbi:hypothetical protein [Sorangium cellulosum]|nr:hypothetical protein [Sorangium cellulosum]
MMSLEPTAHAVSSLVASYQCIFRPATTISHSHDATLRFDVHEAQGFDGHVANDRTCAYRGVIRCDHQFARFRCDNEGIPQLIAAFAHVLLTLLGEAGERAGLDRLLKTNTVKHRTLSLYNQGCYWYTAIPNMREERLVQLMTAYGEVLREHAVTREILGTI